MRRFGALVLLAVAAAPGSRVPLAQDAALHFEVASVRASGPPPAGTRGGRFGPVPNSPDRVTYERVLFRRLLMDAYGVERDQIKGPEWATADAVDGGALFDISAKAPPGATKEQVATMLQNLGGTFKDGTVRIRFRDYPLFDLVQQFSFALAAHVVDRTGLVIDYVERTPTPN